MKDHAILCRRVGVDGEMAACNFLVKNSYKIRGRNIRLGKLEIDILAEDPIDHVLVFVEVKSRSRLHEEYRPELNVTYRKRSAMTKAARRWVADHGYEGGYRLDLICIAHGQVVNHFKEIETSS